MAIVLLKPSVTSAKVIFAFFGKKPLVGDVALDTAVLLPMIFSGGVKPAA